MLIIQQSPYNCSEKYIIEFTYMNKDNILQQEKEYLYSNSKIAHNAIIEYFISTFSEHYRNIDIIKITCNGFCMKHKFVLLNGDIIYTDSFVRGPNTKGCWHNLTRDNDDFQTWVEGVGFETIDPNVNYIFGIPEDILLKMQYK